MKGMLIPLQRKALICLKGGELTLYRLAVKMGIQGGLLKYHIKRLMDMNLIVHEVRDNKTVYAINPKNVFLKEDALFVRIEDELQVFAKKGSSFEKFFKT